MNEWIYHGGDRRTAPATPGLLIIDTFYSIDLVRNVWHRTEFIQANISNVSFVLGYFWDLNQFEVLVKCSIVLENGPNQLCCPCFATPPLTETAEALQPWEMKVTVVVQSWCWKDPPPQVFCHLLFFLPVALFPATPVCEYSCLATASCQVSNVITRSILSTVPRSNVPVNTKITVSVSTLSAVPVSIISTFPVLGKA